MDRVRVTWQQALYLLPQSSPLPHNEYTIVPFGKEHRPSGKPLAWATRGRQEGTIRTHHADSETKGHGEHAVSTPSAPEDHGGINREWVLLLHPEDYCGINRDGVWRLQSSATEMLVGGYPRGSPEAHSLPGEVLCTKHWFGSAVKPQSTWFKQQALVQLTVQTNQLSWPLSPSPKWMLAAQRGRWGGMQFLGAELRVKPGDRSSNSSSHMRKSWRWFLAGLPMPFSKHSFLSEQNMKEQRPKKYNKAWLMILNTGVGCLPCV